MQDEAKSVARKGDSKDETQADILIRLAGSGKFFKSELEEPHMAVKVGNHIEIMAVKSERTKLYLLKLYYAETGCAPKAESMNQALGILNMKAEFSGKQHELHKRIAMKNNEIYYDLCNKNWSTIKITEEGVKREDNSPILFTRTRNMKKQLEPDLTVQPDELFEMITKHFRFKKKEDLILFTVYLVSCFIPNIAHTIMVLFGEKGSAKSTTMRMIKGIVDPAQQDLLSLPTSKEDLAIILSNNYMPAFDNLDSLSAEKSDMLCMAATGGAFSKRSLYTDKDETILKLKRCVAFNGVNVVATRPDLLDRSIVLELDRIPKIERKTEKEVWEEFTNDIPRMLGAIFNTISKVITGYDDVKLEKVGRMADFTYNGYAIAEVVGIGGDVFLNSYLGNQDRSNEEALASHPVAAAVIALMRSTEEYTGSVSALLTKLQRLAFSEKINTRSRQWANDASVLSKRLKEVKSNLEEIGINYYITNAGSFKKITIVRALDSPLIISNKSNEDSKEIGSVRLASSDDENDFFTEEVDSMEDLE